MPMLGAILTPHPPVLLSEVGKGREREIAATGRAMHDAAGRGGPGGDPMYSSWPRPTPSCTGTISISPPAAAQREICLPSARPQVHIEARYDGALRDEIVRRARAAGLEAGYLGPAGPGS